jgi:bifunctional enzyme CysN/CysC
MTESTRQQMNIVIAGHVDHGKSTVVGRLLADTHSLPEGKLEAVQALCRRNSKPFEYAFLIDALKDEMAQGITIDAARVFFKTPQRDFLIIDAPGHIEFLKNMATGASHAEAALLVIDAQDGVRENSRRHGYMLAMLGIRQIAVLINKMDLVGYDREVFDGIVKAYTAFLEEIAVRPACFIPVSGMAGDNIAAPSANMPWYQGDTVLVCLDRFQKEPAPAGKPFRMPVQDVYKFTEDGDKRRAVAGTVETGRLCVGDEVVFYPSGKRSRVAAIEGFAQPARSRVEAGYATAFTLEEQVYVTRGEIAAKTNESPPKVSTRLLTSLFWMGREPMLPAKEYMVKIGTAKVPATLEKILRVIDASTLEANEKKDRIERHDVAECLLRLRRAAAFDPAAEIPATGRFVVVDGYEIRGGGIIREALEDEQEHIRSLVMTRNTKWETSRISPEERWERYNQRAALILVTGGKGTGRKAIAKALEAQLFSDGKIVYFLGIANVLYGVDADIKVPGQTGDRQEHVRRLAEVAHLLLDAGVILIVTAVGLTQEERLLIETTIGPDKIEVVWVGAGVTPHIEYDLRLDGPDEVAKSVLQIKAMLRDKGIIFRP